jgi:hypothetical protein
MRNKNLFENKIERLESIMKNIEYSFNRNERNEGIQEVAKAKQILEQLSTYLSTETQD